MLLILAGSSAWHHLSTSPPHFPAEVPLRLPDQLLAFEPLSRGLSLGEPKWTQHPCRNLFLTKQSKKCPREQLTRFLHRFWFFPSSPWICRTAQKMSVKDPQPKNREASSGSVMKNSYAVLHEAAARSGGDCPGEERCRARWCCSPSLLHTKRLDRLCPGSRVPMMRTAKQLGPCSPQIAAGTQKFYF